MVPLPPPAPPVANLEKSKPRKEVVERMLGALVTTKVFSADKEIDLFEWTLYQLVSRYCDAHFGRARSVKVKYSTLEEFTEVFTIVLSTLALHGSTHGSTHSSTTDDARQQAFTYAAGSVGLYNIKMLPVEACERKAFSAAVSELACATPFLKQRLLRGLVKCVRKDAVIVPLERELITAVAAVMESPLVGLELDSSRLG